MEGQSTENMADRIMSLEPAACHNIIKVAARRWYPFEVHRKNTIRPDPSLVDPVLAVYIFSFSHRIVFAESQ